MQNEFTLDMQPTRNPGRRYWITPPDLYSKLNDEFAFDFDPCPCPCPAGYNSLIAPWGRSNYVNPPFNKKDAPHGGPASFARKAINERKNGNTSVFILPIPWAVGILMEAGAAVRPAGVVRWLDVDTRQPCKRSAYQAIFVLRP